MREIKLKAWIPSKKKMLPGVTLSEVIDSGQRMSSFYGTEVALPNDIIYLQYTGLKDKNGIEIYEGDVVMSNPKQGDDEPTVIEWSNDPSWDPDGNFVMWSGYWHSNAMPEEVEVIGNIYEHPELLGAAK